MDTDVFDLQEIKKWGSLFMFFLFVMIVTLAYDIVICLSFGIINGAILI